MKDFFKAKIIKTYKGVTLLETLLYIVLFGLVFVSIVEFFLYISLQNRNARISMQLERAVIFVSEHIEDEIQKSTVNPTNSIFDNDSGVLALQPIDSGEPVIYSSEDSKLIITRGSDSSSLLIPYMELRKFRIERVLGTEGEILGLKLYFTFVREKQERNFDLLVRVDE